MLRRAGETSLIKIFLLFLKPIFYLFPIKYFSDGFITSTASENRFLLMVLLAQPAVEIDFHLQFSFYRLCTRAIFIGSRIGGSEKHR